MGLIFGDGNLADQSQPIIFYLFRAWIVPTWQDLMIMFGIGIFRGLGADFISQA